MAKTQLKLGDFVRPQTGGGVGTIVAKQGKKYRVRTMVGQHAFHSDYTADELILEWRPTYDKPLG